MSRQHSIHDPSPFLASSSSSPSSSYGSNSHSNTSVAAIKRMVQQLRSVLDIRARVMMLIEYPESFVASEFCEASCNLFSMSPKEAEELGQEMLELDLLCRVSEDPTLSVFSCDDRLYGFKLSEEEENRRLLLQMRAQLPLLIEAAENSDLRLVLTLSRSMNSVLGAQQQKLTPCQRLLLLVEFHFIPPQQGVIFELNLSHLSALQYPGGTADTVHWMSDRVRLFRRGSLVQEHKLSSLRLLYDSKHRIWSFSAGTGEAFRMASRESSAVPVVARISKDHEMRLISSFAEALLSGAPLGILSQCIAREPHSSDCPRRLLRVFASVGLHVGLLESVMRRELEAAASASFLLRESSPSGLLIARLFQETGERLLRGTVHSLKRLTVLSSDELTQQLFDSLIAHLKDYPDSIRYTFRMIHTVVEPVFPGRSLDVMIAALLIRFICPALEGASGDHSSKLRQVSSTMRKLAIGKSELDVVQENHAVLKTFCRTLFSGAKSEPAAIPAERSVLLEDLRSLYAVVHGCSSDLAKLNSVRLAGNQTAFQFVAQMEPLPTIHNALPDGHSERPKRRSLSLRKSGTIGQIRHGGAGKPRPVSGPSARLRRSDDDQLTRSQSITGVADILHRKDFELSERNYQSLGRSFKIRAEMTSPGNASSLNYRLPELDALSAEGATAKRSEDGSSRALRTQPSMDSIEFFTETDGTSNSSVEFIGNNRKSPRRMLLTQPSMDSIEFFETEDTE